MTLTLAYSGRLPRQRIQEESLELRGDRPLLRLLVDARRTARLAAGRCVVDAVGAQVVVQQPQLLVPAGPGHRLRDGADAHHRAGRVRRGRVRSARARFSHRGAGINDGCEGRRAQRVHLRGSAADPVSQHRRLQDGARRCRHGGARHRAAAAGRDRSARRVHAGAAALPGREGVGHSPGGRAQYRALDRRGEQAAGPIGAATRSRPPRTSFVCTRRWSAMCPSMRSRWRCWRTSCPAGTRRATSR